MLLLLHCINGLVHVSQKTDKNVQMYAYESHSHTNNLLLPCFPTYNMTLRTIKDSVSVIICPEKNALKDKSNTSSIIFSDIAAKFTKKNDYIFL